MLVAMVDRALASGLRDDDGFFLMELGVQNAVFDAVRERLVQSLHTARGDLEDRRDLAAVLGSERILRDRQLFQQRPQLRDGERRAALVVLVGCAARTAC